MQCKACDETNLALLLLFNEEPALRFPYERLDEELHSEFLIRAHGARGDELKSVVREWLNETAMTSDSWMRKERRLLKRSKPSVFLDSPELKKRMVSKHGKLQGIISAGPSYILNAGPAGDITGTNMYAVDAVDTFTQEHTQCHLAVYNSYTLLCYGVFHVRPGRSCPCEV